MADEPLSISDLKADLDVALRTLDIVTAERNRLREKADAFDRIRQIIQAASNE